MAETTFTSPSLHQSICNSSSFIKSKLPPHLCSPRIGIVCGSGLSGLADTVDKETKFEIEYGDIPGFASSTVKGHAGKLTFGVLTGGGGGGYACNEEEKAVVVLMVGRVHFYEGHSIEKVTFPVRVLAKLGIEVLIVTNAAGGLNPEYHVGDIVILNDHINFPGLSGAHPLRGPNIDSLGPRFPPLSNAYDLTLRRSLHLSFKKLSSNVLPPSRRLHEGVYAFVSGPSFETRAECRMLRLLGADLVGMSTVPEIIVARHAGLKVLALSLVTNKAVLDPTPRGDDLSVEDLGAVPGVDLNKIIEIGKATHEEVLQTGREAARDMQELVNTFVKDLMEGKKKSIEKLVN